MKYLSLALIIALSGCGISAPDTYSDFNQTIENNVTVDEVINIDNNVTISDDETINIDITIDSKEVAAYGDGTFLNPYLMMNANYKLSSGEQWFITPTLNSNCTIRVRTRVYITNIVAEDSYLLPIGIKRITDSVFDFDVNASWATLSFNASDQGYVTIASECLDSPKIFNIDYGE